MNIREKVAQALYEFWWFKIEGFSGDPYFGSSANLWEKWLPAADRIITAFLEAAAEPDEQTGTRWHMRPDEATYKMIVAGDTIRVPDGFMDSRYKAMLAAAPKFEWKSDS